MCSSGVGASGASTGYASWNTSSIAARTSSPSSAYASRAVPRRNSRPSPLARYRCCASGSIGTGDEVPGATVRAETNDCPRLARDIPETLPETIAVVTPTAARAPTAKARPLVEADRDASLPPDDESRARFGRSCRAWRGKRQRASVSARPDFGCSPTTFVVSAEEKGSPAAVKVVRVTGTGNETHREPLRRHVRPRESAHRRGKSRFRRSRARACLWIVALGFIRC